MNHLRPRSRPAVPSAVLAAAVLLSLSSTADVTVAAVLMNAGRQLPARFADPAALGQWISRYSDVARQIRELIQPGTEGAKAFSRADLVCLEKSLEKLLKKSFFTMSSSSPGVWDHPYSPLRLLQGSPDAPPPAAPMRSHLADLPPPVR